MGGDGLLRAGPVWGVSKPIPGSTLMSMGSVVSPLPLLERTDDGRILDESCCDTDIGREPMICFTMSSFFISENGVVGIGTEGISLTEGGLVDPPPKTKNRREKI